MGREEFVDTLSPLFQGTRWLAERAFQERPFRSIYDLRRALHSALFAATPQQRLELLGRYPTLASPALVEGGLRPESTRDQVIAGLDRLTPEESSAFARLTSAYHDKFGFPFIVAVRENTKETILAEGQARLRNTVEQEQATALVEIAKIANLRLLDLVEAPAEEAELVGAEH
jgi:OHCU decarboxylase